MPGCRLQAFRLLCSHPLAHLGWARLHRMLLQSRARRAPLEEAAVMARLLPFPAIVGQWALGGVVGLFGLAPEASRVPLREGGLVYSWWVWVLGP